MPLLLYSLNLVRILSLTLLLSFFSPLFAQQVDFKEKSFDFGVVAQGDTLTHDFQILNTGAADLIIRKISPACGCMAAVAESALESLREIESRCPGRAEYEK